MDQRFLEKSCRYSIRKLTVWAFTVLIGVSFFRVQGALAQVNEKAGVAEEGGDEIAEKVVVTQ